MCMMDPDASALATSEICLECMNGDFPQGVGYCPQPCMQLLEANNCGSCALETFDMPR